MRTILCYNSKLCESHHSFVEGEYVEISSISNLFNEKSYTSSKGSADMLAKSILIMFATTDRWRLLRVDGNEDENAVH